MTIEGPLGPGEQPDQLETFDDGVPITSTGFQDSIGQADPTSGALSGIDRSNRGSLLAFTRIWDQARVDLENKLADITELDLEIIKEINRSIFAEAIFSNNLFINALFLQTVTQGVLFLYPSEFATPALLAAFFNTPDSGLQDSIDNDIIPATQDLNDAIDNYNTVKADFDMGSATQQDLDDAIDAYNAEVANYNAAISSTNTSLDSFSEEITAWNDSINDPLNPTNNTNIDITNQVLDELGYEGSIPQKTPIPTVDLIPEATTIDAMSPPISIANFQDPPAIDSVVFPELPYPTFFSEELGLTPFEYTDPFNDILNSVISLINASFILVGSFITFELFPAILERALEAFVSNLAEEPEISEDNYEEVIEEELDERVRFNNLASPILPSAFSEPTKQQIETAVSGAGSGGGYNTYRISLSFTSNLERVTSKEMFETIVRESGLPIPPRIFDVLNRSLERIFFNTGLLSSFPAARLIRDKLSGLGPGSSSPDVALSLQAIITISKFITEGEINTLIADVLTKQLQGQGNFPPDIVNQLANSLSAVFKIQLLGGGITGLARALGLPGLTPQILANLSGLSEGDARLAASVPSGRLSEFLRGPLSVVALENEVPGSIAALQNIENIDGFSLDDLKRRILDEFAKAGEEQTEAIRKAREATERILAELGITPLDLIIERAINPTEVANILKDQAKAIGLNPDDVQTATRNALTTGSFESLRDLREGLVDAFREQDISDKQALFLGNQAVNFLSTGSVTPETGITGSRLESIGGLLGDSPAIERALGRGPFASEQQFLAALRSEVGNNAAVDSAVAQIAPGGGSITEPGLGQVLSLDAIGNELETAVQNVLKKELDDETKGKLGSAIVDELIKKPNSTINLVAEEIRNLKDSVDEGIADEVHGNLVSMLRDISRPSAENAFLTDRSLTDGPSTFISNIAQAGKAEKMGDTMRLGPA